jgi:hypothetical protein
VLGTLALASLTQSPLHGVQVHRALREEYGEPFREGDIIGCLLHMPDGGRHFEKDKSVRPPSFCEWQPRQQYAPGGGGQPSAELVLE